jgi:hypothetical protein
MEFDAQSQRQLHDIWRRVNKLAGMVAQDTCYEL